MKLKTRFQDEDFEIGEVVDVDIATMPDGRIKLQGVAKAGGLHTIFYDKLENLYDEWEDAPEEPKEYWYINSDSAIYATDYGKYPDSDLLREEIGNYFETKEEAEKAVEKLKAWKRLKDKGFKFEGIKEDYTRILQEPFRTGKRYLHFNKSEDEEWMEENWNDLELLFGGEE